MYLLPKEHPATKKILESPTNIPCDIYMETNGDSAKQQIDDFMKFVESHLNKVKKSHTQRSTTRVSTKKNVCASISRDERKMRLSSTVNDGLFKKNLQ